MPKTTGSKFMAVLHYGHKLKSGNACDSFLTKISPLFASPFSRFFSILLNVLRSLTWSFVLLPSNTQKSILVLLIAALVTASQLTFPIHRMVQFQKKSKLYGSQQNNGELRLASLSSILNLGEDSRMKADHYTALVMMNELSELTLVSLVDQSDVGGLVIIIPSVGKETDGEIVSKCREVEQYMLKRSFPCPVYFIEEDKDVMAVYNSLQSNSVSLTVLVFRRPHP